MNLKRRIYLDHGASTPVDPRVIEAMAPYWATVYANPSATHQEGRLAAQALDDARQTIARLFNVQPDEVIFTGGGSASDNLALRGVLWAARQAGRGSHLITSAIEHPAVLQTAVQLRDLFGFAVTVLPVDENGRVQPADVAAAIRPDTALISIMAANNEIGTLQPVAEIGAIARAHFERGAKAWNKPDAAGPVTEADLAANEALHGQLALNRSQHLVQRLAAR